MRRVTGQPPKVAPERQTPGIIVQTHGRPDYGFGLFLHCHEPSVGNDAGEGIIKSLGIPSKPTGQTHHFIEMLLMARLVVMDLVPGSGLYFKRLTDQSLGSYHSELGFLDTTYRNAAR